MAEEEKETEEKEVPAKKSKKMLILMLGGVIALGGGGATAYFMFFTGSPEQLAANAAVEQARQDSERAILSLTPFVVNLNGSDANRFAKVTLRLLLPDQATVDKILADKVIMTMLRDRVLTLLASKSLAEVSTAVGKESLRHEIASRIEDALDGTPVSEVYFAEFVVQ
ncbi:MAG: flagellar basal body-associated protein FliL [Acidobacteriota bacterium]